MDNIPMMFTNFFTKYTPLQILIMVAVLLAFFWILTIIFRTAGLIASLEQAVSIVIQEICSILLGGFQLSIKLFQAVEVYLILLIDILTGKATSEQKISVLASSTLSIASFYTTYLGWQYVTSNRVIATLLTIGIQTLLLRTSLKIGLEMDWSKTEKGSLRGTAVGIVLLFVLATAGYLVNKISTLSYFKLQAFNHIVTYFSIFSLLWIFFSYIRSISKLKMKNGQNGQLLLVIYFLTLAVSSFFSFQSFFIILYPAEMRILDQFTEAKQNVLQCILSIDRQVDASFYLSLSEQASTELKDIKTSLDSSAANELQALAAELESDAESYAEYTKANGVIKDAENEVFRLNEQLSKDKNNILGNKKNDIGYQTRMLIAQLETQNQKNVDTQKRIIHEQEELLSANKFFNSPALLADYEDKQQRLSDLISQETLSSQLLRTTSLLLLDEWTSQEVEEFLALVAIIQDAFPDTSLGMIAPLLSEYKKYCYDYRTHVSQISTLYLKTSSSDLAKGYETVRQELFAHSHAILEAVPRRNTPVRINGKRLVPAMVPVEEITSSLEQEYAVSNMNRHIFHQNMAAFWRARIPGILSALIAVMIDNLILFVGLITPKQMEYFQEVLKNDPEKKKIMLEHLFSKPSKRA